MNQFINKSISSIVLIIFFGAIMTRTTDASIGINVTTFPSSVTAGQEFEISFETSGLEPNRNYYIKGLGGENFTEVDTWNGDWFQQNAAWASMPFFGSGLVGSPSGTLKVRFDSKTESGTKDFKIRIKKSDSNDTNIDSALVSISVAALPPTPSPTPEPTRVSTPTPTQVKNPAPVLLPTKTPSPKLPISKIPEATPQVLGEIAADQTMIPVATSSGEQRDNNKNKSPYIAVFLIILGFGFVGASIYFAFRERKRTSDPETLL